MTHALLLAASLIGNTPVEQSLIGYVETRNGRMTVERFVASHTTRRRQSHGRLRIIIDDADGSTRVWEPGGDKPILLAGDDESLLVPGLPY